MPEQIFLGLTNKGLNSYRKPSWGGWGGRYVYQLVTLMATISNFHYAEAGFVPGQNLAAVTLSQPGAARTTLTVTDACRPTWLPLNRPCATSVARIILAVSDDGSPALTSYRRIILHIRATPAATSGTGKGQSN